jgi:hypothetical protein
MQWFKTFEAGGGIADPRRMHPMHRCIPASRRGQQGQTGRD